MSDQTYFENDDATQMFKAIWLYCMLDHGEGTLPGGPCSDCIRRYARTGPPDGRWNSSSNK